MRSWRVKEADLEADPAFGSHSEAGAEQVVPVDMSDYHVRASQSYIKRSSSIVS
jgi:hypothetical protein